MVLGMWSWREAISVACSVGVSTASTYRVWWRIDQASEGSQAGVSIVSAVPWQASPTIDPRMP